MRVCFLFLIVTIASLIIISGCGSGSNEPDGDTVDGDKLEGDIADGDFLDGDVSESDESDLETTDGDMAEVEHDVELDKEADATESDIDGDLEGESAIETDTDLDAEIDAEVENDIEPEIESEDDANEIDIIDSDMEADNEVEIETEAEAESDEEIEVEQESETTGLIWQDPPNDEHMTWYEARTYCENLTQDGKLDWRMPTVEEARSLLRGCSGSESTGGCGVIDTCVEFSCWNSYCGQCELSEGPAGGCYWPEGTTGLCGWAWTTGEYNYQYQDRVWIVGYHTGNIDGTLPTNDRIIRCVRSSL